MRITRVTDRKLASEIVQTSNYDCARWFAHFLPDDIGRGVIVVAEWNRDEEEGDPPNQEVIEHDLYGYSVPESDCTNPVHTMPLADNEAVVCFVCGGTRNV